MRGAWATTRINAGAHKTFPFPQRSKRSPGVIAGALALCSLLSASDAAHAAVCETLITATLPNATVTSAVTQSGTITGVNGVSYSGMPPFCAVTILATPTNDSSINILVWMPLTWTGRFEGTGNGGYAGSTAVATPAMVNAVKRGWAVQGNDLGTAPSNIVNGDPMIGHPQKWIDWGYRANVLSTTLAKQIVTLFYGNAPTYSYFDGCSTGGQQALRLAQDNPDLYDGIVAGAPAYDRTHTHASIMWIYAQSHATLARLVTSDKVSAITDAVVQACAAQSGGLASDKFLTDARQCRWNPSDLQSLSADQVATANAIYQGPQDPVWGHQIFPGSIKGSENDALFGWNFTMAGGEPAFDSLFKWVFGTGWQWQSFDYHQSMLDTDAVLAGILNNSNADLSAFRARQGKLIQYHGFADPLVSPHTSIDFYTRAARAIGNRAYSAASLAELQKSQRLFMAPGLGHCVIGPGPNVFGNDAGTANASDPPADTAEYSLMRALERWVEQGVPPDQIISTQFSSGSGPSGTIAMQRPLCPYPKFAHYKGSGDINAAASFECADTAPTTSLLSAVLPVSRSVQVGKTATAFAIIINNGANPALQCSLTTGQDVSAVFGYRTTNPLTNQVTGTPNTPVDIPAGGSQSFVFFITPTAALDAADVAISASCINSFDAPLTVGLNSFLLSGSNAPIPDVVSLSATVGNNGIVDVGGLDTAGAFAVATINLGAAAAITASADTGSATLPVTLSLCQTNPATSVCTSAAGPTVTTTIAANATPTFAIFVKGNGAVPFDPANNRIFVRFKDAGGIVRGATSVAVRTQ